MHAGGRLLPMAGVWRRGRPLTFPPASRSRCWPQCRSHPPLPPSPSAVGNAEVAASKVTKQGRRQPPRREVKTAGGAAHARAMNGGESTAVHAVPYLQAVVDGRVQLQLLGALHRLQPNHHMAHHLRWAGRGVGGGSQRVAGARLGGCRFCYEPRLLQPAAQGGLTTSQLLQSGAAASVPQRPAARKGRPHYPGSCSCHHPPPCRTPCRSRPPGSLSPPASAPSPPPHTPPWSP